MNQPENRSTFEDLERRALEQMTDESDDDTPAPDLLAELGAPRAEDAEGKEAEAVEATLGAYMDRHDRVPAFEGADGMPYTVDVDTEETGDPARPFAAFLVFIRWAETGAGIMDHVESGDVAFGQSEEQAKLAAHDLSLYEVKAELDRAIERRRQATEE
ncbi:MAG TPA: hypothetical protein VF035_03430 [Longimicrobiales bacterium]